MPSERSFVDGVGRCPEVAAGDDEVGLETDDLLGVDALERGDDRQRTAPRAGSSRRPRPWPRRGRRRRACRGSRSRPGSATRSSAVRRRSRPPCPRRRSGWRGRPGAGVGSGVGLRWSRRVAERPRRWRRRSAALARVEPEPVQAPTTSRTDEQSAPKTARVDGRAWDGHGGTPPDRAGAARASGNREPLASMVEGGVFSRWCARSCLPFSRRFEHAPWGRRPDFRPGSGDGHRSGTVPESHRLRDHAAWYWMSAASVAQRPRRMSRR